jgi:hypothetical protein
MRAARAYRSPAGNLVEETADVTLLARPYDLAGASEVETSPGSAPRRAQSCQQSEEGSSTMMNWASGSLASLPAHFLIDEHSGMWR